MNLLQAKPLQIVLTLVAVLSIGAFAAGCGSDDGDDSAPAETTAPAADTQPAPPDEAGVTVDVSAVNNTFDPAEVTVAAGEAVRWTNADTVAHDVTSEDGTLAGLIPDAGSEFSHTFSDPGTYAYTCTLHPGMDGTVIVE